MDENKQEICNAFCEVLKLTRAAHDLQEIRYKDENGCENAYLIFEHGMACVNVSLDSGIAMIRDIAKAL